MNGKLLMLDLCAGLKGASAAMTERGWEVVTVDNDPKFEPTIVADVREFKWTGRRPDLVWSSPPCIEFSRESMPWTRRGIVPDMAIVEACVRVSRETNSRFWLLENVRGALKWFRPTLGEPRYRAAPQFLWGVAPVTFQLPSVKLFKKQHSSDRADLRAMVPWHLSLALARAVELDKGDRRRRRRDAAETVVAVAQRDAGDARAAEENDVGDRGARAAAAEFGRNQGSPGPSMSAELGEDLRELVDNRDLPADEPGPNYAACDVDQLRLPGLA